MSDDRKRIGDHFYYLKEYIEHLKESKLPEMSHQNLLLSKYVVGRNPTDSYLSANLAFWKYEGPEPRLNFKVYSQSLWLLIKDKSFFKRFNVLPEGSDKKAMYERIMAKASVELYGKGQVVFTTERVGVVLMGSLEIRKHNNKDLLKPYVVKKAIEGDIIGWGKGDKRYSSSALSWIVSMQDNTEVIFFTKSDWNKIWGLQKSFTEQ